MILNFNSNADIHLWFTYPDRIQDEDLLHYYHECMSAEETEQYQRYQFQKHRHQYLVTRALIRETLSYYCPYEPAAWCFKKNEHGKPEIDLSNEVMPVRFNLSHTDEIAVCAVTPQYDVGVDVESTQRDASIHALAERYFSKGECEEFFQFAPSEQADAFFRYWTLKEAYIKARGMGLALPLGKFSFYHKDLQNLRVTFDQSLDDDLTPWNFMWLYIDQIFCISVALKNLSKEAGNLSIYHSTPFRNLNLTPQTIPFPSTKPLNFGGEVSLKQTTLPKE